MNFLTVALFVLFVISSILLIVVILLQEGKGGGLGEAFGGVGGETFGHKAGGVNKFTGLLAAVMMVSAIVINATAKPNAGPVGSYRENVKEQPVLPPNVPPPGVVPPANPPNENPAPPPGGEKPAESKPGK